MNNFTKIAIALDAGSVVTSGQPVNYAYVGLRDRDNIGSPGVRKRRRHRKAQKQARRNNRR